MGRSRGGYSTKIHVAVEAIAHPVKWIVTAGQENDAPWVLPLLTDLVFKLLFDKGYDSEEFLQRRGA